MIFLIQYDRESGMLVQSEEYAANDRQIAEQARLHVELSLLTSNIPHEVVLLEATNQDELRKTHRRYFERLDQLLRPVLVATP